VAHWPDAMIEKRLYFAIDLPKAKLAERFGNK
jgi:hypothetical protein